MRTKAQRDRLAITSKRWRENNKDKIKQNNIMNAKYRESHNIMNAKYRESHRVVLASYQRKRMNEIRSDPTRWALYQRQSYIGHIRRTYHLDWSNFEQMLISQSGLCANPGCNKQLFRKVEPHVDHNHETGEVRGLLCNHCNSSLGLLRENHKIILGLCEYLDVMKEIERQESVNVKK